MEMQEWLLGGAGVVNSLRRRAWISVIFAAIVLFGVFLTPWGRQWTPHHGTSPSMDSGTELRAADALAAAGRLREAQDAYLTILLTGSVRNPKAMEGLVSVRRRLAHDNPEMLRQQAGVYLDAAGRGVDTPEHYSPESMRLLAAASLLAAVRAEAARPKDKGQRRAGSSAQSQVSASGHLREEQDAYLAILLGGAGNNEGAMQRLVSLRRQMAHDNPYILRQQARTYLDAASHGVETEEHYKPESMRLLAAASLMAALQAQADHLKARHRAGSIGPLRVFRTPPAVSNPTVAGEGQEAPGGVNHSMMKTKPPVLEAPPQNRGTTSVPAQTERVSYQGSPPAPGLPVPIGTPKVRPAVVPFKPSAADKRSGEIDAVNCRQRSFVLRDGGQRHVYATTDATVTFVSKTRITGNCPLQKFIGSRAIVWSTERFAERIEVLQSQPASRYPADPFSGPSHENDATTRHQ